MQQRYVHFNIVALHRVVVLEGSPRVLTHDVPQQQTAQYLAGSSKRRMSWILDTMYLFISWGRFPMDRSRFLTCSYEGLLLRMTSAAADLTFFS